MPGRADPHSDQLVLGSFSSQKLPGGEGKRRKSRPERRGGKAGSLVSALPAPHASCSCQLPELLLGVEPGNPLAGPGLLLHGKALASVRLGPPVSPPSRRSSTRLPSSSSSGAWVPRGSAPGAGSAFCPESRSLSHTSPPAVFEDIMGRGDVQK